MNRNYSIIVEGPDGVGKTTVAGKMSELTKIPVFKCPVEKQLFKDGGKQSLWFDYMLTHFVEQTGAQFLSDRSYPSEKVYSKIFERETDEHLLCAIDDRHAVIGTKILYLYSSVQPIEPDDIVPSDKYWPLKNEYDNFCEWTQCEVIKYDTAQSLHLVGEERAMFDTKKCMELLKL